MSITMAKQNSELCSVVPLHLKYVPSSMSSFNKVEMRQYCLAKDHRLFLTPNILTLYLNLRYTSYY